MKTLLTFMVLLIINSCSIFGQTTVYNVSKSGLTLGNSNSQHYLRFNIYHRKKLIDTKVVAPNEYFQSNHKIPTIKYSKKTTVETIYDESTYKLDLESHLQKINNAKYLRDEGALRGCLDKMRRDAIWRSIVGGLGGDKIITFFDGLNSLNGEPVSMKRLMQDGDLYFGDGDKIDRKLEWIKQQFDNISETDPFEYCPNLENNIRAYDRMYNSLLNDRQIQDFAKNNLDKSQSNATLFNIMDKKSKSQLRQKLPKLMIDASLYTDNALDEAAIQTNGKEVSMSFALFRTFYFKKGGRTRIYFTFGEGDYQINYIPQNQYTSFNLSSTSESFQSFSIPSNESSNIKLQNDYFKSGLKMVLSSGVLSIALEGGINTIYKNRINIKSDKFYNITNNSIIENKNFNISNKFLSYFSNNQINSYWKIEAKANVLRFNKSLPSERMSLNLGAFFSGYNLNNSLNSQAKIETIRYSNNKITEITQVDFKQLPMNLGVTIGLNF